jgi:hypothetical protein
VDAPSGHVSANRSYSGLKALLVVALISLVALASGLVSASSGHAASPQTTCTKTLNLVFMFYANRGVDLSGKNSCWGAALPVPKPGGTVYLACSYPNMVLSGQGGSLSRFIFDDTNPTHNLSSESAAISSHCSYPGGLTDWGEFAAPANAQWCTNAGLNQPCWRRNGSFLKYFAELYQGAHVWTLSVRDHWDCAVNPNGGWGAYCNNSRPVINIGQAGNAGEPTVAAAVAWECSKTATGGYMAMYAGINMTTTHIGAIITALNQCTT